jgi:hypothetical protein
MAIPPLHRASCGAYVYQIIVDGIVRYIGKGRGYRMGRHLQIARVINRSRLSGHKVKALKFHNRLAKAMRDGAIIETRKIFERLSDRAALNMEVEAIASMPSGQLWNETAGGEGIDSETAKRFWSDPDYRAKAMEARTSEAFRNKARENNLRQFADPEQRKRSRERSMKLWEDPSFREKILKYTSVMWDDPILRDRHKAAVAKGWEENPERRQRRSEISRLISSKPEIRKRMSDQSKRLWKDPLFREKAMSHWTDPKRKLEIVASWTPEFLAERGRAISRGLLDSEAAKRRWKDPATIEKLRAANDKHWKSPESRAAQSRKMKELWADPEFRAKTTAHWAEKRKLKNDRP